MLPFVRFRKRFSIKFKTINRTIISCKIHIETKPNLMTNLLLRAPDTDIEPFIIMRTKHKRKLFTVMGHDGTVHLDFNSSV